MKNFGFSRILVTVCLFIDPEIFSRGIDLASDRDLRKLTVEELMNIVLPSYFSFDARLTWRKSMSKLPSQDRTCLTNATLNPQQYEFRETFILNAHGGL